MDAFDVLIIGSGIAGLTAALTAGPRARVAIVCKDELGAGSSAWAQGGIAAAVGDDDSAELHLHDTVAAGRGLCDVDAVRLMVEEAPARIEDLRSWGVHFDSEGERLSLSREAGHARARIIHAHDATGHAIQTALVERVRAGGCAIIPGARARRLVIDAAQRCVGAEIVDTRTGHVSVVAAPAVILATGGAGDLWRVTTNPSGTSGEGVMLGYDAGAEVASLEFMQFHPTVLMHRDAPHFLLSEAMRGEGAFIINARGDRFTLAADPRGELAPRDVVASAIWGEMARSGEDHVFLDCRHLAPAVSARFPTIAATSREWGIDIGRDLIPIAPAAHYFIGGVRTDRNGATRVPGLYAAGEVASTGVHGANRLASNSLLEAVVFGRRAADTACRDRGEAPPPRIAASAVRQEDREMHVDPALDDAIRESMWHSVGLVRDADGLRRARDHAGELVERSGGPDSSSPVAAHARLAELISIAALAREETRGCHVRSDFPISNEHWHGLSVMQREEGFRCDRHA